MSGSKKRKPGRTSRKSGGQAGPRKPRGSQGLVSGGELGSVGERDATLAWTQDKFTPDLKLTDPEMLHPALAGYSGDDGVPVIFAEGPEKPDGAIRMIGRTRVPATMDNGTVLPPGTRLWLSSADPGEIRGAAAQTMRFGDLPDMIAADRDQRGVLANRAGDPGFSPDLAAKLARGLSPEELSDPAILSQIVAGTGGVSGRYAFTERDDIIHDYALAGLPEAGTIPAKIVIGGSRDDGGDGLPHEMQPGDVIADRQPLGYVDAGITLTPDGEIQPGDKVWRPDPAGMLQADTAPAPEQVRKDQALAEELNRRADRLIAGGVPHTDVPHTQAAAELIRLRDRWSADEVLSQHAWLTHHYRNPGDDLADFLAYLMRTTVEQQTRAAGMYWPVDLSGGPADRPQGRELARVLSLGLGDAATFQVTAPMVIRMRDTWEGAVTVHELDEGELPAPAGFAWLDKPWLMRLSAGYWLPVRAVSWEKTSLLVRATDSGRVVSQDAARIVLWLAIADDVAFGRWDSETRAEKVAVQVGRLAPQHVAVIPFGTPLNLPAGFRSQSESMLGLLHTLWMYLGMMLPKSRPVRASAPAVAKRARASLRHDEVHIVTLREYDYISDDPPASFPNKIDWQCRWWVGDFYRHIDKYEDADEHGRRRRHKAVPAGRNGYVTSDDHDICAVCLAHGRSVRIALVHTHARGPSDKPFRTPAPGRTVYKLAR